MKKINKINISLTIILFCFGIVYGQNEGSEFLIHNIIQKKTDSIYDSLVNIRRHFHEYPELSAQELKTSKFIEKYLSSLGLEVKTNIGGYGVIGILKSGNSGKRIAWRTDIDALKTNFEEIVDYKSKTEGVRHICGHDVHTTIGLGMANVLASLKANLNGTVYFIFQPAEEINKGAKSMINDGLFDIISPDEIYSLHVNPMPVGAVSAKANEVYAYVKVIKITFKNQDTSTDKIQFAKDILLKQMNIESDSKFWNYQNLGDPEIGLSNRQSIYQNYLIVDQNFKIEENESEISLEAYLTGTSKTKLDSLLQKVKSQIIDSDFKNQLVSVGFTNEYQTVKNDPILTEKSLAIISRIYGEQSVSPIYGVVPNFNDDFSNYQKKIPGVYFFLGASNFQKGFIAMPHSPNFAVDEECIKTGVKYFSSMVVERLNSR
ncbi:MAG: amidohydrolase [Flavobacteriaceae bacterium]|nr:amidohydrolase [Flavobacteriaceae bacterium]